MINGTLDLQTGVLRPHHRTDMITRLAPVEYHADALCPRFDRFLREIFGDNPALQGYVLRLLGMCLTGDIREEVLPIFNGDGANGKSVLLGLVKHIMGDYASDAAPDLLIQSRHAKHPTEIADLYGRRLVVASETEDGAVLHLQVVKRLTGERTLKGRFMHGNFFSFERTHKLILMTNKLPRVNEDTEAAWRRLRLVPFT